MPQWIHQGTNIRCSGGRRPIRCETQQQLQYIPFLCSFLSGWKKFCLKHSLIPLCRNNDRTHFITGFYFNSVGMSIKTLKNNFYNDNDCSAHFNISSPNCSVWGVDSSVFKRLPLCLEVKYKGPQNNSISHSNIFIAWKLMESNGIDFWPDVLWPSSICSGSNAEINIVCY